VLEAVIGRTALYSRLEDGVYLRDLADETLLDVDAVADELKALREKAVITYVPGLGAGNRSRIGLPLDESGVADTPRFADDERGVADTEKGGHATPEKEGGADPPPIEREDFRVELLEGKPAAERIVADFVDEACARGSGVQPATRRAFTREVELLLARRVPPTQLAQGLQRALDRRLLRPQLLEQLVSEAALPFARDRKQQLTAHDFSDLD
jgi:hypothetical protein